MGIASGLELREHEGAVGFEVRVSTRSSRDAIKEVREGVLRVSLAAPPVEGAANAALIGLLARALRVPRKAVVIARGERSKTKLVRVRGVDGESVRQALERQLDS